MAPRGTGKAKAQKLRGEKRKKEKVSVPYEVDIAVNLPDCSHVLLKAISTDRILDVRRLLSVHVHTCHLTRFSLHHEVRGARLRDAQEVSFLKPPVLTLCEEDYDEGQAVAHVRRLLDIMACISCFGPSARENELQGNQSGSQSSPEKAVGGVEVQTKSDASCDPGESVSEGGLAQERMSAEVGKQDRSVQNNGRCIQKGYEARALAPAAVVAAAKEATERGDMSGMCPPSELGQFYEFFSFAHLTPPLQFLRRTAKQEKQDDAAFFTIEVRLCNGKLATVTACASGFHSDGKQFLRSHTLVALLKRLSQAFSKAYDLLLKAFSERNKFGNLPYGLRSNTWVVPPIAAEVPSFFHPLPTEDETWGGSGGGQGRAEKGRDRPWAQEFAILARMPCGSVEERRIRDKKAFLLHNLFVDVAVTVAATTIQQLQALANYDSLKNGEWHEEEVWNIVVRVSRDGTDAGNKYETKIEGSHLRGKTASDLAERNLLKGITADENTTVQDQETFGVVVVRHRGYIAVVEAVGLNAVDTASLPDDFYIEDQPEGGANSLNVNSLRTLLHTKSADSLELELEVAEKRLEGVLERSLARLESEEALSSSSIRLELGACWLQHLQTEAGSKDVKAKVAPGRDQGNAEEVKRTPESPSRVEKDNADTQANAEAVPVVDASQPQCVPQGAGEELELRTRLNEAAFNRLEQSGAGLHVKTVAELMDGAKIFYEEVALTKLVSDFSSLELAPVDGRSLSDFMHARGLRMHSLGRVAELAAKLPHVQSLCEHEMVTRALKHVVRASVASSDCTVPLAPIIASTFNFAFGSWPTEENTTCTGNPLLWKWVETFVTKRYNWTLGDSTRSELRKYAVLRGLCHKVGIEIAARNYRMDSPSPFSILDIISMVPVYKHVSCSSADGRTLLESCKAALDKGKGDEAIKYGAKALNKLMYVCGPYHRMTAGAYSLLAVVLYHTGDYNQAMIYQQKALDINERELGLDHPDTIKSYGDVAVFYYRLQHTELAVKYVTRALYLLHLICGPSHPNSAATYINVAMMEEGLGNIHISLRYLHEALTCNQRLLGPDHTQTAASFHAMAIVLSMMEAYTLSVQHEQTTLHILEEKLGPEDPRTQDSAAWLQYFDSKAVEQQEAARKGTPKADMSIAVKGHLSVADLVEYIGSEVSEKGITKGAARRAIKSKGKGSSVEGLTSAGWVGELSSISLVLAEARDPTATSGEAMGMESQPLGTMEEITSPDNVNHVASKGEANGVSVVNGEGNSCTGKANGVSAVNSERGQLNDGVSIVNGDGGSASAASNTGFVVNGMASEVEATVSVTPVSSKEDEGWQEAAHRGRSAHGNGRRNGAKGSFNGNGVPTQGVRNTPGNRETWEVGGRRFSGVANGNGAANGNAYHDRNRRVKPAPNSRPGSPGLASVSETSRKVGSLAPGKQQSQSKVVVPGADSPSDEPKANGAPTAVVKTVSENSVPSRNLNGAEPTPARSPRAGISYKDAALALHVEVRPSHACGKVNDTESEPLADRQAQSTTGVKNASQDEVALHDKVNVVGKNVIVPGKRWADVDFDVNDKPPVLGERILNGISNGVAKACDNGYKTKHSNGVERHGHKDNAVFKEFAKLKGASKVREEKQKPKVGGSPAKVYDNGHATGLANGHCDDVCRAVEHAPRVKGVVQNGHGAPEHGCSTGANGTSEVKSDPGTGRNGLTLNSNGHHVIEASMGHESTPGAEAAMSNGGEWNITFGRVAECDIETSAESTSSGDTESSSGSEALGESKEHVEPPSEAISNSINDAEGQSLAKTVADCGASHILEQIPGEEETDVPQGGVVVHSPVEGAEIGQPELCRKKPTLSRHVTTRLSASAPAFTPTSKPVTRVVAAVTPFKAGKAPVPVASTVRPAVLSTVPTTIAVTPIRKTGPPLACGIGYSQVQGGLAPPNLTTSVSIVQPEPSFLKCSASGGGGVDKARVLDEKRVTMNPNAMEYIPRTMNPNAAVFVPSRMLGIGEAASPSNKSGSGGISEGSGVGSFFVGSQDVGSSLDAVVPSPSVAADATLVAEGRKDEPMLIEISKANNSSPLNPEAESYGNSEEASS